MDNIVDSLPKMGAKARNYRTFPDLTNFVPDCICSYLTDSYIVSDGFLAAPQHNNAKDLPKSTQLVHGIILASAREELLRT